MRKLYLFLVLVAMMMVSAVGAQAAKVYFNNPNNWNPVKAYFYKGSVNNTWPGVEMTKADGDTYWSVEIPSNCEGGYVIFNNNDNKEQFPASTGLQLGTSSMLCVLQADHSSYTWEVYSDGPAPEAFTVYFDNSTANWSSPKIHYWGGTSATTWPGVDMNVAKGKIYSYQVAAGTTGVIFNNGNGTQTSDITPTANHLYDNSGTDKGEYNPEAGVTVEAPENLYILGTIGETFWDTNTGIEMTKSDKKFTAQNVEIKASKAGATYGLFTFVTSTGANWDAVNGHDRYGADAVEDVVLTEGTTDTMAKYAANVNASAAKSWKLSPGIYTIEADFATMKVSASQTGSGPTAGTGALAVTPVTINPGRDATIKISIADATKRMKSLQFDITVPDCVTAGAPLISRTMGSHKLMYNTVDGNLRVVIYSESNEEFSSTNGDIIYLPISAKSNANVGTYSVTLSNITFADADLLAVKADDITAEAAITVATASDYVITVNKTVLALAYGGSETLTATFTPEDGTTATKTVTWTSSDSNVATVDSYGKVTAGANGTAVITASCTGATSGTCTVYVGKQPQTITWDQTIAPLGVGEDDVDLTATASSGNAVTYEITSGTAYASIDKGKLHAVAPGIVTITATQAGDDTYAPAEPVSKTVTIWIGYIEGDVNDDNYITLADVVATVDFILGKNPASFNQAAADVDGDGSITVADVAQIVDKVIKKVAPASSSKPARIAGYAAAAEQFTVSASSYALQVSFTNQNNYVASLFEVTLPEGVEITAASIAGSNHAVLTHRVNEATTRVLVYSTENKNFASDGYVNLTVSEAKPGEVAIDRATIVSTDGVNVEESEAIGTEIHVTGLIGVNADSDNDAVYYNLQGVRVSNPSNGVYVRVSGNKADKVLVK